MTLSEAKKLLNKEKRSIGVKPFSRNIIGMTLQSVAREHGIESADRLIDECGL